LSVFKEAIRIFIKFIFIHELVHVKQFKNGMTMEEYRRTKYKESEFEKEANEKAAEILSRDGEFQREIVRIINNNKPTDIYVVEELSKLYEDSLAQQ
jgi:Zn-dependent peptidase ImmA (M78 family)